MKTIVIEYPHPQSAANDKGKPLFKSLFYGVFCILTFWIPGIERLRKSIGDWYSKDYIGYWYIEVDIETGLPQREVGFGPCNRASLVAPTDKDRGFWIDSNMTFEVNQYPVIDSEIFNDIFEALAAHDINCVWRKNEKYFLKWTDSEYIETPQLPLLIYDLTNYNETLYCNSWSLFSDVDITGYEWDSEKRVIDSKGNIYKTTYINFGHPVGSVYPEKIEETISLDDFKNLLKTNFEQIDDEKLTGSTFQELFDKFELKN